MSRYWNNGLIVFILSTTTVFAESGMRLDIASGAMLYDNHCIQCHAQQLTGENIIA